MAELENAVTFSIGERFSSYKDLEEKIRRFEESNYCQLWKRDSRTVTAARKRLTRHLADEIKYDERSCYCAGTGSRLALLPEPVMTFDPENDL